MSWKLSFKHRWHENFIFLGFAMVQVFIRLEGTFSKYTSSHSLWCRQQIYNVKDDHGIETCNKTILPIRYQTKDGLMDPCENNSHGSLINYRGNCAVSNINTVTEANVSRSREEALKFCSVETAKKISSSEMIFRNRSEYKWSTNKKSKNGNTSLRMLRSKVRIRNSSENK